MHDTILSSSRDTALVAVPFVVMLLMTIFRLDEAIATRKKSYSGSRLGCGLDERGEPILRDPDGTVVEPRHSRKKEG
jgi:hypothetical protein